MMSIVRKVAKTKTFHKANRQLSRLVMGTNIGLHFHVFSYQNVLQARKTYPSPLQDRFPETTRDFRKKGYATKPTTYRADLIAKIKKKFLILIEDKQYYVNDLSPGYSGPADVRRALRKPLVDLPELKDLIDDSVIAQLEAYYGSHVDVFRAVAWRNYHVPGKFLSTEVEVYSNNWHFDQRTTDVAKLFVNLSDVTEEDGPFHIMSRQRSRQLLRMGYGHRANYGISSAEMEDPKYVVKAVGPAGTGLYCNTEVCLHRADVPKEGHYRDIVQFQFRPSSKPLAVNWYRDDSVNDIEG